MVIAVPAAGCQGSKTPARGPSARELSVVVKPPVSISRLLLSPEMKNRPCRLCPSAGEVKT